MDHLTDIRPSPIAGRWYPADPTRLAQSVDGYLAAVQLPQINGEVIAIMAPHAGHVYSGPVAGYAFAALRGMQPEIVVVVSPMHHPYFQSLLTSGHQAYETPLGSVPIDQEAVQSLSQHLAELGYPLSPVRHDEEHSLEIELPFLQRVLDKDFRLVPVMVREVSLKVVRTLGQSLAKILIGKKAVLVASTDLSHFYTQEQANKLDQELLRRVEAFDPEAVLRAEDEGKGFACGRGALAAVLWAAKDLGADQVKLLHYATSGDVTGDFSQVVGYGAAVVYKKKDDVN
jgi:AmmeMemoRadiSam system protein B